MRRTTMLAAAAAGLSAMLTMLAASPAAFAGYGAFALDATAHKFGYSANQPDQQRADQLALKNCKSDNCKIVFPIGPRRCGALATSDVAGTAWGGAVKPTRDAAQLAAIADCQKHTAGQCKLRAVGCNR
jgi:hypothetical protein